MTAPFYDSYELSPDLICGVTDSGDQNKQAGRSSKK